MRNSLTNTLGVVAVLGLSAAISAYAQSGAEERDIPAFTRIAVQNGIDVELTQAATQRVRIETVDYDLADIVTEVVDGELRISNDARRRGSFFGSSGDVLVYLDIVSLSSIRASGGSDIEGRNQLSSDALVVEASGGSDVELAVQTEQLSLRLSGGSDAEVRGAARSLTAEASGGSDIEAGSLEAEEATVRVSGGSDATIWASASVDINASGGSDVSVLGNPPQQRVNNDRSSDIVVRR
jgi:hypothetical protein